MQPRERAEYELQLIRCSFSANEEEQWLPIPFPPISGSTSATTNGQYFISTFGRVKRITKKQGNKILSPQYTPIGFWVTMRDHTNKTFGRRTDRLMAIFAGISYENVRKPIHKDGCLFNNNLKNLEFLLWEQRCNTYP